MRLAEGSRLLTDARARAATARLALASQIERFNLLQGADLVAPRKAAVGFSFLNGERAFHGRHRAVDKSALWLRSGRSQMR